MRNVRLLRLRSYGALIAIEGKNEYVNAEKPSALRMVETDFLQDALRGNVVRMGQTHDALQADLIEANVHGGLCRFGREPQCSRSRK